MVDDGEDGAGVGADACPRAAVRAERSRAIKHYTRLTSKGILGRTKITMQQKIMWLVSERTAVAP
jgi:hypothetical protein